MKGDSSIEQIEKTSIGPVDKRRLHPLRLFQVFYILLHETVFSGGTWIEINKITVTILCL